MNLEEALTEKLKALQAERKLSRLAQETGISQASLSRAAHGKQELGLNAVSRLLDFFELEVVPAGGIPDEFVMVAKVSAKAGAGSSCLTGGDVQGYYAFRLPFLQRVGISPNQCVMLDVMGDSMQPLIMNGDTILVDKSQTTPQDGKIFLVGLGEELLVKRLQRTPRGWLLVSQNTEYAPIPVEDCDLESFRIHGRVRWFGRVV